VSTIRYERRGDGKISAWVSASGDRVVLRQCGELLTTAFGAQAVERFDGGDQIFWDFLTAGTPITLHWHRDEGIAVIGGNTSPTTETLVKTIAEQLVRRVPA
jgi:hypothetical protein